MDTHCYAGYTVSPYYDPMLAKLIVKGKDRDEAVGRLLSALEEFHIGGIQTNIPFLRKLCASADYRSGDVDTSWVPRFLAEGGLG